MGPFWDDEIRSFREGGSETQTNISVRLISVGLISVRLISVGLISVRLISVGLISELISKVLDVTYRDIRYFDI